MSRVGILVLLVANLLIPRASAQLGPLHVSGDGYELPARFEPYDMGLTRDELWEIPIDESQPLAAELAEPPVSSARGRSPAGPGGPRGMMGGGPPGYEVTWYPAQTLAEQPGDFGLVRQNLSLGGPLWRSEGDMVLATVSVKHSAFLTDAVLPDSLQPFPEELWSINFGVNYMHEYANGWKSGLIAVIGSASDQPFASSRELTGNLGAFLRVPARNGRDS